MTDRELKRLSRIELIDIIYELQTQNEQSAAEVAALQKQLDDRLLRIDECGSIAEAALRVSGVFEAAQSAADQFLNSVYAANADMDEKRLETEHQCAQLLREAEKKAQQTLDDAEKKAETLVHEAETRADEIIKGANARSEEDWKQFHARADEFIRMHPELCAP